MYCKFSARNRQGFRYRPHKVSAQRKRRFSVSEHSTILVYNQYSIYSFRSITGRKMGSAAFSFLPHFQNADGVQPPSATIICRHSSARYIFEALNKSTDLVREIAIRDKQFDYRCYFIWQAEPTDRNACLQSKCRQRELFEISKESQGGTLSDSGAFPIIVVSVRWLATDNFMA